MVVAGHVRLAKQHHVHLAHIISTTQSDKAWA
jgi:hypothetical protein